MEWYELRKLAGASSFSDVSNVVYSRMLNTDTWNMGSVSALQSKTCVISHVPLCPHIPMYS